MVTTSDGKHFSLGLEFELLTGSSYSDFMKYTTDVQDLFRRLLTFPIVTVAAVNGVLTVVCWLTGANSVVQACARADPENYEGGVGGRVTSEHTCASDVPLHLATSPDSTHKIGGSGDILSSFFIC